MRYQDSIFGFAQRGKVLFGLSSGGHFTFQLNPKFSPHLIYHLEIFCYYVSRRTLHSSLQYRGCDNLERSLILVPKMRLLNTQTLKLKEFPDDQIPNYAILSHTWENEEVSCQEMITPTPEVKKKAGYDKIKRAAANAKGEKYEWIWIDTCCIDKSSSAELSEAINSMYRWYRNAQVCAVYLSDVENPESWGNPDIGHSRWFTRLVCMVQLPTSPC